MAYWLFKSEPDCFSFADLLAAPGRATGWDGVRNFQARNFLRDEVRVGDGVLFYHSGGKPPAIAGIAEVVEAGHPDPTAFDPSADHHDPASRPEAPTWFQVAIRAVRPIEPPLGLPDLRQVAALEGMELLRKGSRLSVQPVRPEEWRAVLDLAGAPDPDPTPPEDAPSWPGSSTSPSSPPTRRRSRTSTSKPSGSA